LPYDITIKATFSAAHQIRFNGVVEPLHGHDWKVTISLGAYELDDLGLVCDFHSVQRELKNIVRPFKNNNMNDVPPFNDLNPTAENVAKYIGETLAKSFDSDQARVLWCRVTEAPGCAARWIAD
jgi:6-pyruvoyltetrahydropterin/6-carboxytetrahydropterin synthase